MGTIHTRRKLLSFGAAALTYSIGTPALAGLGVPRPIYYRQLALRNINTGDALTAVYWINDHYIPRSLRQIDWVLRDFHAGLTHPIAPQLLDLLVALQLKLDTNEPFQVTSGYRSPRTNARLAAYHEGVAAHSLHTKGMAVDVTLGGRSLDRLYGAALALEGGGVGYYPANGFVHLDVGPVRQWEG